MRPACRRRSPRCCSDRLRLPGRRVLRCPARRGATTPPTVATGDVLDLVPYSSVKCRTPPSGTSSRCASPTATPMSCRSRMPCACPPIRRAGGRDDRWVRSTVARRPGSEPSRGELADGDVVPLARPRPARPSRSCSPPCPWRERRRPGAVRHHDRAQRRARRRETSVRSALQQLGGLVAAGGAEADIVRRSRGSTAERDVQAQQACSSTCRAGAAGVEVLVEQREGSPRCSSPSPALVVGTRSSSLPRDLLANLRDLQPPSPQLAVAAEDIPKSLDISPLYPFAKGTPNVFQRLRNIF